MENIIEFVLSTGNLLLYYIIPMIIVLGIMIFFHELGHFLAAKSFNVKVLKFALGFGPKITAKEVGETEYSIRYIPLGGFVKMLGEDENIEESGEIAPEDEKRAFNRQHPLKRITIVAAGPIFNLLLAFLLFLGLFMVSGDYILTPEIGSVKEGSPAERAGILKGDIVVSVQDVRIEKWEDIKDIVQKQAGKPLLITVERAGRLHSYSVIPEESLEQNEFGEEVKRALIGIVNSGEVVNVKLSLFGAFKESLYQTWRWIKLTCLVVVKLFQGAVSIKTVGGPILIGQMTGQIVQESISSLIPFMAIISINLAILNLFPIPILDGGVILFLIFEMLLKRPISIDKRELAQKIGLSILLLLMMVVFYNDILRLFR